MIQLDLGCGNIPRLQPGMHSVLGVDIADVENPNVRKADLAIGPVPFDDNVFDLVTAFDFMEHIPAYVYLPEFVWSTMAGGQVYNGVKRRDSMIELFNEIYRVLKPGGEFYFESPLWPDIAAFKDPGHIFFWTAESLHYFTGDYFGFHDHYGHRSKFELLVKDTSDKRLRARLKAIKPDEPPYLVGSVT